MNFVDEGKESEGKGVLGFATENLANLSMIETFKELQSVILQTTAVEHKMMDIFLNDANVDFE